MQVQLTKILHIILLHGFKTLPDILPAMTSMGI